MTQYEYGLMILSHFFKSQIKPYLTTILFLNNRNYKYGKCGSISIIRC